MTRYFFVRDGAVQGDRDSKEEAADWARRTMGWDLHFGRHIFRGEFANRLVSYSLEEHTYDWEARKWNRNWTIYLNLEQAIHPYPERRVS